MKSLRTLLYLLLPLILFIQCDLSDDNNLELDSNVGTFVVWMTDAPVDIENLKQVNFILEDIIIRNAEDGDIINLQDERVTINLMNFRNGNMQIIAGSSRIPVGLYDRAQLDIVNLQVVLEGPTNDDDDDIDLNVSAPNTITIDLQPNAEVAGARNTELMLDVDLYQSLIQQQIDDNFINSIRFDPVIRWAILGNTGRIQGTILTENSLLVSRALVKLFRNNELIATTFSEDNGDFGFAGLSPGTFNLSIEKSGLAPDTLSTEVSAQQTSNVDIRLDSLSAN